MLGNCSFVKNYDRLNVDYVASGPLEFDEFVEDYLWV